MIPYPVGVPDMHLGNWARHVAGSALLALATSASLLAAQARHVVVDQTGLPLPGAHIEVRRGSQSIATLDTGFDGGFDLPAEVRPDDVIDVSLNGFETAHVAPRDAQRVVLILAKA